MGMASFLLSAAAVTVLVEQPPNEIVKAPGSVAPGTIVTAKKGDIIYRQPLGRPNVKALQDDLEFAYKGQNVRITREEQLIPSSLTGSAADKLMYRFRFYCTVARPTGKKRIVGMSEIGAVGMDLDRIKKLRFGHTQNCVVDSDGDGLVDRAVIADTGDRTELVPVAVQPTAMRDAGFQQMPGESEARIMFDGMVGIIGNMSVSLQIVEEGRPLAFGNGQTMFRAASIPRTVETFGAKLTVLSYDSVAKTAQIRIDQGFSGGPYQVQTTIERR